MFIFLNLDSVLEIISFSKPFPGKQHKRHGNEFILFEIAKTNTEMMAKQFWHHCNISNLMSEL